MSRRLARGHFPEVGIEGALFALAPLPLAGVGLGAGAGFENLVLVRLVVASIAAVCLFTGAALFVRRTWIGRSAALLGLGLAWLSLGPWMVSSPVVALATSSLALIAGFGIADQRITVRVSRVSSHRDRCRQRARWGTTVACAVGGLLAIADAPLASMTAGCAVAGIAGIAVTLGLQWGWNLGEERRAWYRITAMVIAAIALAVFGGVALAGHPALGLALVAGAIRVAIPSDGSGDRPSTSWMTPFIDHPARLLVSTFLALCIVGTLGLMLPIASSGTAIAPLDAVFTAVSAVCVTGLIVLDTPHDFSVFGQAVILALIQLGGLGIMTISTTALHVLGKRMSLRQERLLHAMTDSDAGDLNAALVLVVKFTLIAELLGACLLTALFMTAGDALGPAAWRALFTAISAYCNAGFALQSDSLVPYAGMPSILHVIGLLIIAGGMAPAMALAVPRWFRGRRVHVATHLVLVSTVLMLVIGFALILALEWRGGLAELSLADKVHNAWFQSVTLRTAGFNSIDLSGVADPTLLLMLVFMFIGGSPGGTAGGIKTTTVAVLAVAMWANVTGHREAYVRDRHLPPTLVYRAIAVVGAGALIWLLLVLSLSLTQAIATRDLVFEATSALGTVGLSTGATGQLDGIGKVLIIVGMFLGRVGPLTLFMLLGDEPKIERHHRPDAQIPIT